MRRGAAKVALPHDLPPSVTRLIHRQRVVMVIAVVAAVLSLAGMGASTLVKSPAQRAADQGPPSPSVLTAPVRTEVLRSTVRVRATVASIDSVPVTPTAPAGASALVVTGTPKKAGDAVSPGDVVVQVSGRPIIALPGTVPAYRSLTPGMSGPDVGQLQKALKALGYADTEQSGTFGASTQRAVGALYHDRGFEPLTTGDVAGQSEVSAVKAARDAVTQAERKVAASTVAVSAAPDAATRTAAVVQLGYDKQDLASAKSAQVALQATVGVEVPMAEVVFVPSFPASIGSMNAQVGTVLADTTSPLLTIQTGNLVIQGTLPAGQQRLVTSGLEATIDDEANSRTADGTVTAVNALPNGSAGGKSATSTSAGQLAAGPAGYPFVVTPSAALDPSWAGADVLVTITAASTSGPVLVAPAAAVTTSADGSTSVSVRSADGTTRREIVTTGAIGDDGVEVTPAEGATLKDGDNVVTGQ